MNLPMLAAPDMFHQVLGVTWTRNRCTPGDSSGRSPRASASQVLPRQPGRGGLDLGHRERAGRAHAPECLQERERFVRPARDREQARGQAQPIHDHARARLCDQLAQERDAKIPGVGSSPSSPGA